MADKKMKRKAVDMPQDLNEANEFIQKIGTAQRRIQDIRSRLNQKIARLQAKAVEISQTYESEVAELLDGLYSFAEANRAELTDGNKTKTVPLPAGQMFWRLTPPKVNIKNNETVVDELRKLGLKKFIRTIEEPDKEAMLKEPDLAKTIKGVSISQHEEFTVKPNEARVEISKKKKI